MFSRGVFIPNTIDGGVHHGWTTPCPPAQHLVQKKQVVYTANVLGFARSTQRREQWMLAASCSCGTPGHGTIFHGVSALICTRYGLSMFWSTKKRRCLTSRKKKTPPKKCSTRPRVFECCSILGTPSLTYYVRDQYSSSISETTPRNSLHSTPPCVPFCLWLGFGPSMLRGCLEYSAG